MSQVFGQAVPPSAEEADGAAARRWMAVAVLCVCVLVPFMDVTMTSIDLPKITRELSITWVDAQWAVGGYLLACGIGMLVVPAIGERWGYRHTLLSGFTLFGMGAVVAAWAPGAGIFIVARLLMGLGAATVLPAWVSINTAMFPVRRRRRAFAIGTASVTATTPFGPLVGGALLDHYWHGSLFVLDAVIAALVVPLIGWLTPETRSGGARRPDLTGIGLAACTAVALFSAFAVAQVGWQFAARLAAAAALLTGFVLRQRTTAEPLIDLAVLRTPRFIWSQLAISVVNLAWTGALFLLPTYFEMVRGASALTVAVLLVPLAAMASVASLIIDRVTRRLGERWTVITGLLLFAAGLALLSLLTPRSGYALILSALALSGLGAGLPQTPALVTALGALPESRAANGPGVINALRHIGGALGAAAGGLTVATVYAHGLSMPGTPPGPAAAHATVVNAVNAVAGFRSAAYIAFTHGVSTSLRGGAILLLALAVLAMVLSGGAARRAR